MKSPSDINEKKLNVIVSVCLVKSKNGYGNYKKLLLSKLQLISTNIIASIIISSFIASINNLIINIKHLVQKTTSNTKSTKQSESGIRPFQKASSIIMLHRLLNFCHNKKQQQQHKQQYLFQHKGQHHRYQIEEVLIAISTTGLEPLSYNHKLRRNNDSKANYNTKSKITSNNCKNIINKSNFQIYTIRISASSLTSGSTVLLITPTKSTTTDRIGRNNCIQINNTNNKHRKISYRIGETKISDSHWNRYQKHCNILRKNRKLFFVGCYKYKELFTTSASKTLNNLVELNVSLFLSSLLSLSCLATPFLLSSLSSSFKQYTWCFLLSLSLNIFQLTKTSLSSLSLASTSSLSLFFLLNAPKIVENQV